MWLKENRTISRKTKKASQSWMSKSTFNLESFCCTICCQMPVSINNWSKKIAWTRFSNFQVIPVKMVYNGGSLEQTLSLWETIQCTPPPSCRTILPPPGKETTHPSEIFDLGHLWSLLMYESFKSEHTDICICYNNLDKVYHTHIYAILECKTITPPRKQLHEKPCNLLISNVYKLFSQSF